MTTKDTGSIEPSDIGVEDLPSEEAGSQQVKEREHGGCDIFESLLCVGARRTSCHENACGTVLR